MNLEKINRSLLKTAQLSWLLCLLAFFIPYCRVSLNGSAYQQFLFKIYPGQIALAFCFLLFALQFGLLRFRKKWLSWPGIIAGIYLLSMSIQLSINLFKDLQSQEKENLALVIQANNQPMAGLYLLAIGSIGLLLSSSAIAVSQRKNRALA